MTTNIDHIYSGWLLAVVAHHDLLQLTIHYLKHFITSAVGLGQQQWINNSNKYWPYWMVHTLGRHMINYECWSCCIPSVNSTTEIEQHHWTCWLLALENTIVINDITNDNDTKNSSELHVLLVQTINISIQLILWFNHLQPPSGCAWQVTDVPHPHSFHLEPTESRTPQDIDH